MSRRPAEETKGTLHNREMSAGELLTVFTSKHVIRYRGQSNTNISTHTHTHTIDPTSAREGELAVSTTGQCVSNMASGIYGCVASIFYFKTSCI